MTSRFPHRLAHISSSSSWNVGTKVKEEAYDVQVATFARVSQRFVVSDVDVGATVEEEAHDVHVAIFRLLQSALRLRAATKNLGECISLVTLVARTP